MTELDLWLGGELVATTRLRSGRKRVLHYASTVIERYGSERVVLSCSLPTPGPGESAKTAAFLEGLLPEGEALAAMAAQLRDVRLTVDGAPESSHDVVALLAEYGRECAGAVVVVPHGQPYEPDSGGYVRLDSSRLTALLRNLPVRPLGNDVERNVRMSLAGAQSKLLLARFGGHWYEPYGGAASTHILKPVTRWAESARNEAIVMAVAHEIGLTPVSSWVETINGTSCFVTERYDRVVSGPRRVRRNHQEDMCQAVGLRPSRKYEIGRPSLRMARLLREQATRPADEVLQLYRQVAFRVIVGDEDGHGKNYSVRLTDGDVTMAPLYDSLCTVVYPELSGHMATPIGRQQSLAKVDDAALVEEAVAMGIPEVRARDVLRELAAGISDALSRLPAELTRGAAGRRVVATIRGRLERLDRGRPLGASAARSAGRRRTLDDLSR